MEKKKNSGGRLEKFFAGKGFYIVLILCLAVIGASSAVLISGSREETNVDIPANVAVIANNGDSIPDAEEPVEAEEPSETLDVPETPVEVEEPAQASEPETTDETWTEETISSNLYVWPLAGEVENPYSMDQLIYNRTMADWRTHNGIDIASDIGTQVMAVSAGKVESIFTDDLYGTTVVIDHYGGLKSIYCNLAETPTVYVGDNISAGEVIGAVGDTAICETGEVAHLHFAMALDGQSVDPSEYLPQR